MRSAARVVCASRRDGYGMIVAEAAAAGTPSVVVAAPESAAPELVNVEDGVNGRVVREPGPAALAAAIVAVVREGETLRRSTADPYERHRDELSMASSIDHRARGLPALTRVPAAARGGAAAAA